MESPDNSFRSSPVEKQTQRNRKHQISGNIAGAAQSRSVRLVGPGAYQEATERYGETGFAAMRSQEHPLIGRI